MYRRAERSLSLAALLVLVACGSGAHSPLIPSSLSGGASSHLQPLFAQQNNGASYIAVNGLGDDLGTYTSVKSAIRNADGNIWVSLFWQSSGPENRFEMAKISDSGAVTRFSSTLGEACGGSGAPLASLRNGTVWYANLLDTSVRNAVCRVTPSGARREITIASLPGDTTIGTAASGPDGNAWFSYEAASGAAAGLLRVTDSGVSTVMPLPVSVKNVISLTSGPDGNLWMTGYDSADHPYVGKMTTAGAFTPYPAPSAVGTIGSVVNAAGNLFVSYLENMGAGLAPGIARISTAGGFATHTNAASTLCTNHACQVSPLVVGPLNSLWFMSDQGLERYVIGTNTFSAPIATPLSTMPAYFAAAYGGDNNLWIGDLYDGQGNTSFGVYVAHVLTTDPTSLALQADGEQRSIVASETNFSGVYYATSSNTNVATVTPSSEDGTFVITAHAPGTATVTVSDSTAAYKANTAPVSVAVQ